MSPPESPVPDRTSDTASPSFRRFAALVAVLAVVATLLALWTPTPMHVAVSLAAAVAVGALVHRHATTLLAFTVVALPAAVWVAVMAGALVR